MKSSVWLRRAFNTLAVSTLTIPLVALDTPNALADKANFQVFNESSLTLTHLYVSDSRRDTWDNDILGQDTLPSGYNIQVVFADASPYVCLYDIRAVFANGQIVEDFQIDVCRNTEYTFFDQ